MALVVNNSVATTEIFSPVFNFYYFPHLLEFGIPVLMFALKLVQKDVKCILSTVSITASSYTVVHFINLLINNVFGLNAKAYLPPVASIILVIISMTLTFVAGLIPARSAAKKDPVVALRSE